ncbi:heme biosynthesis protein HemY [Curvibacter sp. CHRR-16]|uniref:heme biosynthesis HemY N-terminal domain-containing protein n=1 Tax=Curvibacter sp. CHRR-16 TaxID=2835872 RepID=UPI001BDA25D5|nr:heme biosynthesis HemY N-terminal domain-containing protein [Curvibacter sp. CHRR-16]MBT0571383.1 heme biosynthesis protein HemY [Curvibacter sp. CHRR-16]
MRAAVWFLVLFAVAVSLAVLVGSNPGTVTVYWPPYRVDLSLNLVIVALLLAFVVVHVLLSVMGWVGGLPQQARRWRALQRERAMLADLLDALQYLIAGRFVRARKAAERVVELEEVARNHGAVDGDTPSADWPRLAIVAHLIAAESAHAVQDHTRREQHLQHAQQRNEGLGSQDLQEGTILRASRWAFENRDARASLDWLDKLPLGAARRTLALRLKFKAARQGGEIQQALEAVRLLNKHRAFSSVAATGIVRGLVLELLRHAYDTVQLERAWEQLTSGEKTIPDVAFQAAERGLVVGMPAAWVRQCLLPIWEQAIQAQSAVQGGFPLSHRVQLVRLVERSFGQEADSETDGLDKQWLQRVEQVQMANPGDPLWQYLAGMVCMRLALWGKAQQLIRQSLHGLKDSTLRRHAWNTLAELAEQRQDMAAAQQAYREAARSGH